MATLRAVAAICLVVLITMPAVAGPAGSVVGVTGGCVIETGGNRVAAKLSAAVQVGDMVEVPDGGRLRLRMADGSVISIAAGSRMTVTAYGVTDTGQRQEAQLTLQQGLVRAQVVPVRGTPARFEIDTAAATTAVRSTDFFVETQPGWVQTVVLSGTVTLTSAATGAVTTVTPRQGARLEVGHEPATVRAWSTAEIDRLTARTSFPQINPPPRRRARSEAVPPSDQSDRGSARESYPPPIYRPAQPAPYYPPPAYNPPTYVPPYAPPPVYAPPYIPPPGGYFPPRGGYNPPPGGGGGYLPPPGGGTAPPGGVVTQPPRGTPPPVHGSPPPSSTTGPAGQLQ